MLEYSVVQLLSCASRHPSLQISRTGACYKSDLTGTCPTLADAVRVVSVCTKPGRFLFQSTSSPAAAAPAEPAEIERNRVVLLDKLGSGAFGDIHKGMYVHPHCVLTPWTVAVKHIACHSLLIRQLPQV